MTFNIINGGIFIIFVAYAFYKLAVIATGRLRPQRQQLIVFLNALIATCCEYDITQNLSISLI
jgi:hypothetical protein